MLGGIYGVNMKSAYKVENSELKQTILGLALEEAILIVTWVHVGRTALADQVK